MVARGEGLGKRSSTVNSAIDEDKCLSMIINAAGEPDDH
jgi:hypothetical protein